MQATDRIFLLNHYNLLMKDEKNQPLWRNKKILIIQDAALFFEPDVNVSTNELSSIFYNESYRMLLINIDARLVNEINARASELDMSDVPEVPESDDAVVQLIDHKTKTIKLISCKSDAEADVLVNAFKSGMIWSRYFIFCTKENIKPSPKLMDWLIESINTAEYVPLVLDPIDVFGAEYNESITESILEFLRINSLLRTMVITNFDSDELECRIIFQILTSVTGHQIKELSILMSNIDSDSLKILNPGLSHHSHLCKLDLSNNNITDNGLSEIASIFPSITALVELNLSHNLLQGKAEKFEELLTSAQLNLENLKINLSHNKIEDQCITILEISVFHAEEIKITDLDISFNRFSSEGVFKILEAYRQGKNKGKFKLKLMPIPFHEGYLRPIFVEKKANMNLGLERISFFDKDKQPPCSKQWLGDIKKIVRNIRTIRGQSLTIERLATICHEIYGLEYEFPNKKLDELRDIIWDLINRALELEDFYSVTILQASAQKIGLDILSLAPSLRAIRIKANSLCRRMVRVINFDYPEADLNREIDELVVDIFRYDLRGSLVDTILSIKEKRDELIKKMVNSNYKEENEDEDMVPESKKDPFWFLESDLEYAKMNSSNIDELMGYDNNLITHPKHLNYYELCKINEDKLEKDLLSYKEKLSNKDPTYYQMNLYNRSLFLLADHVYKFYLNVWRFAKGDLTLNCSRLAIQYFNFSKRKELCNILEPRPFKPLKMIYLKQNYQTPENLYSFQIEYEMTKYMHIRPMDLEKGDSFHKTLENQQTAGARQHRGGLALADFNPATVKTGGVISELVANEKGGPVKDKEKLGFTKTPLDYVPGPLPGAIRKANSEGFSADAISLYQKIQLILDNDSECQDEKFLKLIQDLLRKLSSSRSTYYPDAEPDALLDECYLQLFRYCNRNKEARINYNQKLAFKLISILSLYAPPSEDLHDHMRAWMFSKISDQSLVPFINKTLSNLMNHESPEFVRPYWIPSLYEIKERLKCEKEILITFAMCDEKAGSLPIHEFETVETFMTKVYDSQYLKPFDDKFSFWLYKAKNSKEEDVALFNDEIMLEVLSFCDENSYVLLLQRRISCMAFSLNYMKLDENHLNSFFYQTKRNYILKDKFSDFCKTDTIAKIAAILYTIERVLKRKKVVAKSEKLQKKLKSLIPESWHFKLTSSQLIQKIIPYLLQSSIINLDLWSLKQEFLNILKSYPLFVGIHYECQIQDNLSGSKNARVDMMLNVNAFGLFFFKMRDKPSRTVYYEELVYIVGCENECSLFFVEKETFIETRMNIFCKHNRARELNEDVVSYSLLRTREKPRVMYGLASLDEFKMRFSGKSTTIKLKKKIDKNEEDEEEDDEWNEEKKRTAEIENEILNNELLFLIDKCFAFHFEYPFYLGMMPMELKNPIPRSKKTKRVSLKLNEKGELVEKKNSVDNIIEGLRKPKTIRDDDDEDKKEIKGILKRPGEDTNPGREKKKTIIREEGREELDPPPKLNTSISSNSSEPKSNALIKTSDRPEAEPRNPKPSFSIAMASKIKMKFKPPPPPPRKPAEDKPKVNLDVPKTDAKDLVSSDSDGDYSDELNMKPKLVDLKPISSTKLGLKVPPPPPKKSPNQSNDIIPQPPLERNEMQKLPTLKNEITEQKEIVNPPVPKIATLSTKDLTKPPPPPPPQPPQIKKNNEVIENVPKPPPPKINIKPSPLVTNMETSIQFEDKADKKDQETSKKDGDFFSKKEINLENSMAMSSSKSGGLIKKERTTPKAQDLNNLDLKSLLKNKIKITGEKGEKDPNSPELKPNNKPKPEAKIETKLEPKTETKPDTKLMSKENDNQRKASIAKEQNEKDLEPLKKLSISKEKKEGDQPQKKLNISLASALKSFPGKSQLKSVKPPMNDVEKFYQLDDEDKSPNIKKEGPSIKKFDNDDISKSKKASVIDNPKVDRKSIFKAQEPKKPSLKGQESNLNEKETKKPSIKNIPPQPETHKQSFTGVPPLAQKEKKESISKIDISNESKHVSQESDNQKKDVSDTSLGQEMEKKEETKPKFERMAIRKKTQKSTPSHSDATSDDMDKSIPNFIKKADGGVEETEEKKEAAPTNKGPQSLSDKLKMRANKLKKNKN